MKKFFDISLLLIGIVFMVIGIYFIISDLSKNENNTPLVIEENKDEIKELLINSCWDNEVISENGEQKKKKICFDETGDFSYKYIDQTTVEEFETYNHFSYKDGVITIESDIVSNPDIIMEIQTINEERMTIKYNNRLVYFIYYCRL